MKHNHNQKCTIIKPLDLRCYPIATTLCQDNALPCIIGTTHRWIRYDALHSRHSGECRWSLHPI